MDQSASAVVVVLLRSRGVHLVLNLVFLYDLTSESVSEELSLRLLNTIERFPILPGDWTNVSCYRFCYDGRDASTASTALFILQDM